MRKLQRGHGALELGKLQFQSTCRAGQLALVMLALDVEQFVDRFADDGNDGLPFRAQRRSDQRLDGSDGEQPRVEPALLALVAASLCGKPCLLLGMPTSPFGERFNGRLRLTLIVSSGRRADRCRGL